MKKYICLLSILLILTIGAKAQQVNRMFNDNPYNSISNDIELLNDSTYICSSMSDIGGSLLSKMLILNNKGDIIREKEFTYLHQYIRLAYRNTFFVDDTLIYVFSHNYIFSDDTLLSIALTCYNLNLDTVWSNQYLKSKTLKYAMTFTQTNDNGFALAALVDKSGSYDYNVFIIKVDSLGQYQWEKEYGDQTVGEITSIVQTEDKGYVLAGESYKYHPSYNDWYIVRTDSTGEQIWDWILRNPDHDVPNIDNFNDGPVESLIQTQDGNFIAVGGKTYTNDPSILKKARLLKFDINKNIILDTLYTEIFEASGNCGEFHSRFVKIKEKKDGHFLILNKKQSSPTSYPQRKTNLYELDANFAVISKRNFGVSPYSISDYESLRDFIIEEDGSLTMIGDVQLNSCDYEKPYQRVWLVKTDNNYCDGFGSCDTNLAIHFFPPDTIPRNDTVYHKFEIISNWDINYDVIFEFYNKDLRLIATDTLNDLSVGDIHQVKISYNRFEASNDSINEVALRYDNPQIEDTVYILNLIMPSDSVSKAIYYTTIRENKIIFVGPHQNIKELHSPESTVSVYPNPAHDYVVVTSEELQTKSCEILDLTGKMLKQFKIQNSEQRIYIGDLEKGLYFIKVEDQIQKLIVE